MQFNRRLKILIPIQCYLPGYKGGGPVRSIANLVEMLGDEVAFFILTADRDFGDKTPYSNIVPNSWQTMGKGKVMYLSPTQMRFFSWVKYVRQTEYDLIYLNSFFASNTRLTLLLRWMGLIPKCPVILSPRGEFSPGALSLKSFKKKLYIEAALRSGLYRDLTWHVTSDSESVDLQAALSHLIMDLSNRIVLASNLLVPSSKPTALLMENIKQVHVLQIVFLSRVARKKNLDFALTILKKIRQTVTFDIYGPKEDLQYWQECEQIIHSLPSNIHVTCHDAVPPDQVPRLLAKYHLLFLPTRGENFGHIIVEAWAAGCPVLISDQTPWRDLEEKGVGWDVPLDEPERYQKVIWQMADMDQAEFFLWSMRAKDFAANLVQEQNKTHLATYRQLFALTSAQSSE